MALALTMVFGVNGNDDGKIRQQSPLIVMGVQG